LSIPARTSSSLKWLRERAAGASLTVFVQSHVTVIYVFEYAFFR